MATTKTDVLPAGYVPQREALQLLGGRSRETLRRLVRDDLVQSLLAPRKGNREERLYLRQSLEAIAPTLNAPPDPEKPAKSSRTELVLATDAAQVIRALIENLRQPPLPPTQKLWLNLEEASQLSGLSRNTLLDLCHTGRLTAFKERGWRIRRASLEAFAG